MRKNLKRNIFVMGDGGKTIGGGNTYTPTGMHKECFWVPNGKVITGAVYSNTGVQSQQVGTKQSTVSNSDCKPCNSWSTRIGSSIGSGIKNFFGYIGRAGGSLLRGVGSVLLGGVGLACNLATGIGNAFCRFGTTLASYRPMGCGCSGQMAFNGYSSPCTPMFSYSSPFSLGGSFASGALFGALAMRNNHHHCHGRPVIINRLGGGLYPHRHHHPLIRPHGWC